MISWMLLAWQLGDEIHEEAYKFLLLHHLIYENCSVLLLIVPGGFRYLRN